MRLPDALRSRTYLARGPAAGMRVSSIAQICRDAVPARVRTTTADRSTSTFFLVNASHAVGEGEMNGREITRLGNGSAYANACSRPASVQHPTHAQRVCACSAVFLAQRTGLSLAFLAWTAKHFTISTCSPLYDGGWLHDGRKPAADWRGALLRPQSLFGWEYHLRTTTASVSAPSFDALMPEILSVCETSPTSLSYRSVKVATF